MQHIKVECICRECSYRKRPPKTATGKIHNCRKTGEILITDPSTTVRVISRIVLPKPSIIATCILWRFAGRSSITPIPITSTRVTTPRWNAISSSLSSIEKATWIRSNVYSRPNLSNNISRSSTNNNSTCTIRWKPTITFSDFTGVARCGCYV